MNSTFNKLLMLMLFIISISNSRILVVVEEDYYNDEPQVITNYMNDLSNYDGVSSQLLIVTHPGSGSTRDQCLPVWILIKDAYENAHGTSAPVTGAVLVGNVPVPIIEGGEFEFFNSDYYYMDVWDTFNNRTYTTDNMWVFPFSTSPLIERFGDYISGTSNGDGIADIWVSRIYARNLEYVRNQNDVWGNFLTENEIISEYFSRVHAWMTGRADVPPRSIALGGIEEYIHLHPDGSIGALKDFLSFEDTDVDLRRYFAYPENVAPNWQSQLQAGPYGNFNSGSYMGQSFGTLHEVDNTYTSEFYPYDTWGYKWAGMIEHGGYEGNSFGGPTERLGHFHALCNVPQWKYVSSGGYQDGSYYWCTSEDKIYPTTTENTNTAGWEIEILNDGDYEFYLWFSPSPNKDNISWFNVLQNGEVVRGGAVNQRTGNNGWNYVCTANLNAGDRVSGQLNAHWGSSEIVNSVVVADALRIVGGGNEIIIDNDDPNFFKDHLWGKERFLYSMRDDGGPSKTKFFVSQVCSINDFIALDNKVGLLYAMAHNGLISFGTSSLNWYTVDNSLFFDNVENQGKTFGESLLDFITNSSNNAVTFPGPGHYHIMGAGTLKSKAYKPFISNDSDLFSITNKAIDRYDAHYLKMDGEMNTNVSVENGGKLLMKAGSKITVSSGFHAKIGSKMHLAINPDLQD